MLWVRGAVCRVVLNPRVRQPFLSLFLPVKMVSDSASRRFCSNNLLRAVSVRTEYSIVSCV
jgi:hypothetical protein